MKPFTRIAALVVTAFSLVLFLANVGLWVRSYSRSDLIMHITTDKPAGGAPAGPLVEYVGRTVFAVASFRGRYQIGSTHQSYAGASLIPDGWRHASMATPLVNAPVASWRTLGFGYSHEVIPPPYVVTQNGVPLDASAAQLAESRNVWIPCWFIAIVTIIDPIVWLRRKRNAAVKKRK